MYGTIRSEWKKDAGSFELLVRIPANCTATVVMPVSDWKKITESGQPIIALTALKNYRQTEDGKVTMELGSGTYEFVYRE